MDNVELAVSRFQAGYSCSQAILCTYGEALGLEQTQALRIADAFSGGMGRTGRTCGAVTGALMVLGLRYGRTDPADADAKAAVSQRVQAFLARFESLHGSSVCKELIECEIDTPEKVAVAKERGLFTTVCAPLVRGAAELLEQMLAAGA